MPIGDEKVVLGVPPEQVESVCRQAISQLGWRVLEEEAGRFLVKEGSSVTSFAWSAKIELVLDDSTVRLNGSIPGVGPVQKNHLKGQLGALRNHLLVASTQALSSTQSASANGSNLSDELERLAALHESGAISAEEFAQAKTRLLESA